MITSVIFILGALLTGAPVPSFALVANANS